MLQTFKAINFSFNKPNINNVMFNGKSYLKALENSISGGLYLTNKALISNDPVPYELIIGQVMYYEFNPEDNTLLITCEVKERIKTELEFAPIFSCIKALIEKIDDDGISHAIAREFTSMYLDTGHDGRGDTGKHTEEWEGKFDLDHSKIS